MAEHTHIANRLRGYFVFRKQFAVLDEYNLFETSATREQSAEELAPNETIRPACLHSRNSRYWLQGRNL